MSLFFQTLANYYDCFMERNKLYKTERVSGFFPGNKSLRVLDLAGGTGVNSDALSRLGHDISVADVSLQMLKVKEKMKRQGEPVCCSAELLPFRNLFFDAVLLTDALHHFDYPDKVFCEIRRILKESGFVLIQEFYPDLFKTRCLNIFERICGEKADYRSPIQLTDFMLKQGFEGEIINIDKYQYFYYGFKTGGEL